MRVQSDDAASALFLQTMGAAIRAGGGYVADEFVVHSVGSELWCEVSRTGVRPGTLLVSYPLDLALPLNSVDWDCHPSRLDVRRFPAHWKSPQRTLLENWAGLMDHTGKLGSLRGRLPFLAVHDAEIRSLLAGLGYSKMLSGVSDIDARTALFACHGMRAGTAPDGRPKWRLIPLKGFVNHHPAGASQANPPGRIQVVASDTSDDPQLFENYGNLDALQALMNFGYVERHAPWAHSLPVLVDGGALGPVQVLSTAPRDPGACPRPETPPLERTEDGFRIRHLSLRPGDRVRLSEFLSLPYLSHGLTRAKAIGQAETLLSRIVVANVQRYEALHDVASRQEAMTGPAADPDGCVYRMIVEVCLIQLDLLKSFVES